MIKKSSSFNLHQTKQAYIDSWCNLPSPLSELGEALSVPWDPEFQMQSRKWVRLSKTFNPMQTSTCYHKQNLPDNADNRKFSSRFCLPIYYYIKRSQINTIWSYLLFAHISLTCHLMINSLYSLLLLDIQKVFIIVFFMMKLFYVYLLGCCRAMAVWKSVVTGKIL